MFANGGTAIAAASNASTTLRLPNSATLHAPRPLHAEEPVGAQHQYDHDDDKGRNLHHAGVDVASGHRLDDADNEAADDRTGEACQSPQHGGSEPFQEKGEADI